MRFEAGSKRSRCEPRQPDMPGLQVLYASSGGGIVVYHRSADGAMTVASTLELPDGGGAFCVSPNRAYLFSATGGTCFTTFAIDPASGALTQCGDPSRPITAGPAYVTTDRTGRFLLYASYGGHSCAVHAIGSDGQVGAELQHEATSNNSHSVATDPTNRFCYVPCIAQQGDVGTGNAIHGYRFDDATGQLTPTAVLRPAKTVPGDGAVSRFGTRGELGPRHLTFHPYLPIVYTANEQGNSVSAWAIDRLSGALSHLQTAPTVPDDFAETTHCSEIVIHPAGTWLLAPNRGHDSVAVFEVDASTGKLSRTFIQPVESLAGSGALTLDGTGQICYVGATDGVLEYFLDVNQGRLTPAGKHATPGDEAAGQLVAVDLPGRDLLAPRM